MALFASNRNVKAFVASFIVGLALNAWSAEPPSWQNGRGYRSFSVTPTGDQAAGFTSMEGQVTGLHFTNVLSRRLVAQNRVTENGSGVALGDVDGDGWCDIYLCGLEGHNVLFRNLGGWRFEDVTQAAGVACERQLSTGAVFADLDGDNDLDLLVNSIGGGTRLFLNDGRGKFSETAGGRLSRRFGSTSMALCDIDLDGDLDLYVANYKTIMGKDEMPRPKVEARMQNGRIVVTPPDRYVALGSQGSNVDIFELAERDFLYVNDGKAGFSPVSWTNGNFFRADSTPLTQPPRDWALSVMMRDINDDGLSDILVCNDFFYSPDRIWIQSLGLQFHEISLDAVRKVSLASMGVDVADINRDGFDDLFFVEMLSRDYAFRQSHRDNLTKAAFNLRVSDPLHRWEAARNTLFLNRGDGTYAEIAELAGVDGSEWSWGAVFLDVDLDGFEDILISTGHNHDVQNADVLRRIAREQGADSIEVRMRDLSYFPKLETPFIAFRNGGGLRFTEKQEEWGLNIPGVANGFACADLDNDGDMDLVANRLNSAALLLRNNSNRERIAIRLRGEGGNTFGIGAKITLRPEKGVGVSQSQRMIAGGRYLSSDDTMRMFAAKRGETFRAEVRWATGTQTVCTGLTENAVYEITQTEAEAGVPSFSTNSTYFADLSELLNHRHIETPFDDFERQPFLTYKLSTQGPAIAWADLDGDGSDDLIIGSSRGGQTAVLRNTGKAFVPITNSMTGSRNLEEQGGVLVARTTERGKPSVFLVASNYETTGKSSAAVRIHSLEGQSAEIPPEIETAGSLAVADVDRDGDLDLFVAGRVIPGRYPAAASSRIYLNRDGTFMLSPEWSKPLEMIGLVASAQFSDVNGDGRVDLVLAVEWGSIQVLLNRGDGFSRMAGAHEGKTGLWTSITTGDFDNDGRTDIVAGNWGRNTQYERFVQAKPMRMYHGDIDGNGHYDAISAIYNLQLKKYVAVAGPEMIIDHLPSAAERIPSFEAYARAGVEEMLESVRAQMLEVNTMESTVFLNRGADFEVRPLPIEAQFAPVFGTAVADFDNDGNEDIVLGQNLFDTRWDLGRLDSGRPLYLRGDGRGNFSVVPTTVSGLASGGQQRGVAVADFNNDGHVDIAMSQNNDQTKLFVNRGAEAGVRIRFEGQGANPDAIGVRYRVLSSAGNSPIREVQCGGGWLSQNSATQVLKQPVVGSRLAVWWPSGAKNEYEVPATAREVVVSEAGIRVVR